MTKVLFCNIGWMEEYKGPDKISGNFRHIREKGEGFECYNFAPNNDGFLYGYVEHQGQIKVGNLGASNGATSIEGVTVVWIAVRKKIGTVIVGWYRDATVFQDEQQIENQSRGKFKMYRIKASKDKATLLPVDARTFKIPRRKGAEWGQSNARYKDNFDESTLFAAGRSSVRYTNKNKLDKDDPFIRRVCEYIENDGFLPASNRKYSGVQDQERKKKIEQTAIDICEEYYKGQGYEVTTVELENKGWDLEARSYKKLLKIEVKGRSVSSFSVELTPNEYAAFTDKKERDTYRLAVVVDALSNPKLTICHYSEEWNDWKCEVIGGNEKAHTLECLKRTGASIHKSPKGQK